MNNEIWNQWIERINWILGIAQKKQWDFSELVIKKTVPKETLEALEKELGLEYPAGFKEVLTQYSSAVYMDWQIEGEEPQGDFRGIFCGGGSGYLWSFKNLKDSYQNMRDWIDECFPDPNDEYDKIWHNKVPFLDVPNGDVIAFDQKGQVVYLSHDGDDFHGQVLGNSFVSFMDKWTQLGCVGTESWQLEPFYNDDSKQFLSDPSKLKVWIDWLEK